MRKLLTILTVLALPVALATHFTGTYVDQQNGVTIVLEMAQDGTIQGVLNGPSGQFQLQGQGNEQGAFGTAQSTQGMLGFQAQLSQDNQTLQIAFFQADQNNQPVQVGGITLQRSAAAGQGGMGMGQTGMGQTGIGQTGMGQTGMGQSGMGMGQTGMGMGQTGMGQSGMGMGQTGMGQTGMGQTGMGQTGMGQTGMGQTGMGQSGMGQTGLGGGQTGFGQTGAAVGDWTGAYVGNAGQLVMHIQSAGQPGSYSGYFDVSGQQFPLQAQGQAEWIEGVFMVNGMQVPFYAERYEGSIWLVDGSDGTEYILEPMNAGAGAMPGAAPVTSPLGGQGQ